MIFMFWAIISFAHLCYTWLLVVAFSKYRPLKSTHQPPISVIIAAHNECKNLRKLLPKLLTQDYINYEVIVALDRCTDGSQVFLEGLDSQKVRYIEIPEVPADWDAKKYALHSAIGLAHTEWLVFTDADCLPLSDQWLKSLSGPMRVDTEIILGVSPHRAGDSLLSHYSRFESFMTALSYIGLAIYGKPYMGVGRNMAIHRAFFLQQNGHHHIKNVTGGDDDLFVQAHATAANTQVVLGKQSLVETEPKKSWKDYFNQKLRHFSVGTRYKKSDQLVLTVNHTAHFFVVTGGFLCYDHPFFIAVLLFYLFIKLVGYRFAAGKIGTSINYMLLPLVDMLYALLTPVIALRSKLVKDITWKN